MSLGALGERLAREYLEREHAFELVQQNYRVGTGEIDLIGAIPAPWGDPQIVFVEVKARRARTSRLPALASITRQKRQRLARLASRWLAEQYGTRAVRARFDVIGLTLDDQDRILSLRHIPAAFDARGNMP